MVSTTVLTNPDEQLWRLLGLPAISGLEIQAEALRTAASPSGAARLEEVLL